MELLEPKVMRSCVFPIALIYCPFLPFRMKEIRGQGGAHCVGVRAVPRAARSGLKSGRPQPCPCATNIPFLVARAALPVP